MIQLVSQLHFFSHKFSNLCLVLDFLFWFAINREFQKIFPKFVKVSEEGSLPEGN